MRSTTRPIARKKRKLTGTSGPRARSVEPTDTALAILETAERLCGERGLEAVSVREIASEAGVNLSAINYYYGSRMKLLLTILKTRTAELDQERRELLAKAAEAKEPDVRKVLRAVLTPLARWRTPESNRKAALQFICRALTTAEPELKAAIDAGVLGFRDTIALLQRAAPHLSFEDVCWRFHFMMSIEHMNFWDVGRLRILSDGRCHSDDLEVARARCRIRRCGFSHTPARTSNSGRFNLSVIVSSHPRAPEQRRMPTASAQGYFSLLLLAFGFGTVFLARNALGYLAPFMAPDLALTPQRLGLLAAAFSLTWAISGTAITALLKSTSQTRLLIALLAGLGAASVLASAASGFIVFLIAWLAAGLCSGPVLPLTQSHAAHLGPETRRGLRMGVVQGLGSSFLGAIAAPLIVVPIAANRSWRSALLSIAALATLSAAALAVAALRHSMPQPPYARAAVVPKLPALVDRDVSRNIVLCCLISVMTIGWLILTTTFFPTFLVVTRHQSPGEMSTLMSVMGVGGLIAAFLVPYLSDRFGRRRTMVACSLLGALGPIALIAPSDSLLLLAAGIFISSFAGGTIPLFMAVIPSDSVRPEQLAMTIGLIQCVGEIGGGVLAPATAGWLAGRLNETTPLLMAGIGAVAASALSTALVERRPRSSQARAGASQ